MSAEPDVRRSPRPSTLGSFALAAPIVAYASFELTHRVLLPAFLTGPLGLSFGYVAALLFGLRMLDIVSDVAVGPVADLRWRGFGGRRGFMVLGAMLAIPAMLAAYHARPGVSALTMAGLLAVAAIGWSLLHAAQAALSLEAGYDLRGRARVFAWRVIAISGAFMFLGFITMGVGGDAAGQLRAAGRALAVATPFLLMLSFIAAPRAPAPEVIRPPEAAPRPRVRDVVTLAWQDPSRVAMAMAFAISGAHAAVWATALVFIFRFSLDLPALVGPALLVQAAASAMGVLLWLGGLHRLGPYRALLAVFALEAGLAALALALPPGEPAAVLSWIAARGVVAGADVMLLRALTGNVLDHDRSAMGVSRAGVIGAAFQLPFSVAAAVATAGLLWSFGFAGLDPDSAKAGTQTRIPLYIAAVAALVLSVLGALCAYVLGRRQHAEHSPRASA